MTNRKYAVFILKPVTGWRRQSVDFSDYQEAQEHAKRVRKLIFGVRKTRVRRVE